MHHTFCREHLKTVKIWEIHGSGKKRHIYLHVSESQSQVRSCSPDLWCKMCPSNRTVFLKITQLILNQDTVEPTLVCHTLSGFKSSVLHQVLCWSSKHVPRRLLGNNITRSVILVPGGTVATLHSSKETVTSREKLPFVQQNSSFKEVFLFPPQTAGGDGCPCFLVYKTAFLLKHPDSGCVHTTGMVLSPDTWRDSHSSWITASSWSPGWTGCGLG